MTSQKNAQTSSELNTNNQLILSINKLNQLRFCQITLLLICFSAFSKDSLLPSSTFIASGDFSLGGSLSFHVKIQLK
ncbi:MAG: hypothetical protein HRT53_02505 [Colwellia sp.]|nr:hypothetical protein [Colwellia sp.]